LALLVPQKIPSALVWFPHRELALLIINMVI
jgi:hypothetical protein